MKIRSTATLIAVLLLSLLAVSCDQQKIADINADPGIYRDKEVQVAGEVTQSIGGLGKGVYQINDGTGSLWVYSDKLGVPTKGAKVGVKGTVLPSFVFLGINYATVVKETDRHAAKGN
jgi:hypothetical protein